MGDVRPITINEEINEMCQEIFEAKNGEVTVHREICTVIRRPNGVTVGHDKTFRVVLSVTQEMTEEEYEEYQEGLADALSY